MEFHEIAEVFPMLNDEDLTALAADIAEHGLHHPVVLFEDKILDGRNRFLACQTAKLKLAKTVQFEGDWDDAVAYVTSENLRRRHLDTSQRAMVADKLANLYRGANQFTSDLEDAQIRASSQEEAAKQLNVSRTSVQSARQVRAKGVPELATLVERGAVSVGAAAEVSKLAEADQRKIIKGGPQAVKAAAAEVRRRLAATEPKPLTPVQLATRARSAADDHIFGLVDAINRAKAHVENLVHKVPEVFKADPETFSLAAGELRSLADWLDSLVTGGITDESLQRLLDGDNT